MTFYDDMQGKGKPPWLILVALVVSVLAHVFILQSRLSLRSEQVFSPTEPEPIEIAELPEEWLRAAPPPEPVKVPAPSREQQIAETENADNEEIDPNAKFLSDRNQKVEQETRAKAVDDFRMRQGTGGKSRTPEEGEARPPTADEDEGPDNDQRLADDDGIGAEKPAKNSGVKRDWKTLSLKDLSVGGDGGAAAASDDRLDGLQDGERTILSTREFRYFSYYHRIKELLRQYWKPNVERKLMKLWGKGQTVGEDELTTKVLVLLDDKGSIQKISRVTSSGFQELDEAAIEAFQKAGPFPNPPNGIVEDDGFVRIRWDFILKTEAAPRIQFQSVGNAPP